MDTDGLESDAVVDSGIDELLRGAQEALSQCMTRGETAWPLRPYGLAHGIL
jgi:hypothetical protein